MSSNDISRRNFVKGTAVTSVVAAGMAATRAVAQPIAADDIAWDKEADVVVIGFGGAGAVSAISAYDAGASVIILEKMAIAGGNTIRSGGGVVTPSDADAAYEYYATLFEASRSVMDDDMVRMFSQKSTENVDWICSLKPGTEMERYGGASFKKTVGAETQDKYGVVSDSAAAAAAPSGHSGADLFALYNYAVEARGIEYLLSTPAERLLTNAAGEVIGCVAATEDGARINVKARKAVILTTGGFEFDAKMQMNNILGSPLQAYGNPGNTGDGVRMAQAVGADLWHMNGVSCTLGFINEEYNIASIFGRLAPTMIWVNKLGKRFANESECEDHGHLLCVGNFDTITLDFNEMPCYLIFDETARQKGRIIMDAAWSADNLTEIERGWIVQADTIAELAEKLGLDPEAVTATVDKWNEDTLAGKDTQFYRTVADGAGAPIATPPFYGIQQIPGIVNTQGGPRRNVNAQVVDAFGSPIPRLYSAGELGSFWGIIYQGAGNNSESVVFGRVAGEHAAALENWDA